MLCEDFAVKPSNAAAMVVSSPLAGEGDRSPST